MVLGHGLYEMESIFEMYIRMLSRSEAKAFSHLEIVKNVVSESVYKRKN